LSKALWTTLQTNTDPSAGDDQVLLDWMTGLSAQGDDGLGGFLFSDETSDLGDRAFGLAGRAHGRKIDASTAGLAVNGLVEGGYVDDRRAEPIGANGGACRFLTVAIAQISDGS
jgi:hypothetical protein